MRHTLRAWRSTSTAPMYTVQSSPNSAAAVAVATPCWPAPVSAMTRFLPMRRVSSACPSTLLILCEPVWVRSSRFRSTRTPSRSESRLHSVTGVGRPAYEPEQPRVLAAERVVVPRAPELRLEVVERVDQRLGREPAAEVAEATQADGLGTGAIELHGCAARGTDIRLRTEDERADLRKEIGSYVRTLRVPMSRRPAER